MATKTTRPSGPGPDVIRDISGYPLKVPRWPLCRRDAARSFDDADRFSARDRQERDPVILAHSDIARWRQGRSRFCFRRFPSPPASMK